MGAAVFGKPAASDGLSLTFDEASLSPLIATLLLIAFAVALGFVVMSWGKSYIEEKAEFTAGAPHDASACGLIELSIIQIGGADRACYNPEAGTIEIFVENGPEVAIDDLQARIVGTAGVQNIEGVLDAPLQRSAAAQIKFSYPTSIGSVLQVKLVPILDLEEEAAFCTSNAAVSENLQQC